MRRVRTTSGAVGRIATRWRSSIRRARHCRRRRERCNSTSGRSSPALGRTSATRSDSFSDSSSVAALAPTTYETGLKGSLLARLRYDLALFETAVRDELIPFEIPGGSGRIYFRNAGRTRRRGVEVESSAEIDALTVSAAYTYSHFRFRDFV